MPFEATLELYFGGKSTENTSKRRKNRKKKKNSFLVYVADLLCTLIFKFWYTRYVQLSQKSYCGATHRRSSKFKYRTTYDTLLPIQPCVIHGCVAWCKDLANVLEKMWREKLFVLELTKLAKHDQKMIFNQFFRTGYVFR